jgi:hypothetical protein
MASAASVAVGDQNQARTIEELERELGEAQRREAATAEVLQIISRSPHRPSVDLSNHRDLSCATVRG